MKQLYFPILSALIICFLVIIFWKGHSWHMYPLYVSLLIITLMLSFNKKRQKTIHLLFFYSCLGWYFLCATLAFSCIFHAQAFRTLRNRRPVCHS
jgi:uncharacterized membrane protein (DUF106 family)